jgi:fermentation-respiration switch protein FrsA (DUF1100 family)
MAEEVHFPSGGLKCAADLYLPEGVKPGERRPGLVVGHGFSLVKSYLVEQAKHFQSLGFVVLTIDYRSFGRSEGDVRGQLFPLNEVEDFRNAITYLQARPEVDAGRIGIWGASFAGALVSYIAAIDRRVKATVAEVPVTDGYLWMKLMRAAHDFDALLKAVEEDRARRYAGEPSRRIPVVGERGELCGMPTEPSLKTFMYQGQKYNPTWADTITLESIEKIIEFSPLSFVHRITPRPYLIIAAGGHDIVHPAAEIAELYERARHPKRLEFLPYDQTALYFGPGLVEANRLAGEFYVEHLKPERITTDADNKAVMAK